MKTAKEQPSLSASTSAKGCRLNIRLSKAEADVLEQKAKKAGLSKTTFILSSVESSMFFDTEDKAVLAKLSRDLSGIGSNINQIARRLNTLNALSSSAQISNEIKECLDYLELLEKEQKSSLQSVRKFLKARR